MSEHSMRHGGPYDRGSADSYYRRGYEPHYYVEGTYSSPRIDEDKMTPEEIAEYRAGYDDNEKSLNFKDWR